MREAPPDILLTNYKMLDQLLLRPGRPADLGQERDCRSLPRPRRVPHLRRRPGHRRRHAAPPPRYCSQEPLDGGRPGHRGRRSRPTAGPGHPGRHIGDAGRTGRSVDDAVTSPKLFSESRSPPTLSSTESRVSVDEWVGRCRGGDPRRRADRHRRAYPSRPADRRPGLGLPCGDRRLGRLTETVLAALLRSDSVRRVSEAAPRLGDVTDPDRLLTLVRALPDVQGWRLGLLTRGRWSTSCDLLFPDAPPDDPADRLTVVDSLVAALSHARALAGRAALAVELNLWVRELTRIDRDASMTTAFRWFDDGPRVGGLDGEALPSGLSRRLLPALRPVGLGCRAGGYRFHPSTRTTPTSADGTPGRKGASGRCSRLWPRDRSLGTGPTDQPEEILGSSGSSSLTGRCGEARRPGRTRRAQRPGAAGSHAQRRRTPTSCPSNDTCPSCLSRTGSGSSGRDRHPALGDALRHCSASGPRPRREEDARLHRQRPGRRPSGRLRRRPARHSLTLRAVLREAVGDDRPTSTRSPNGSSSEPATTRSVATACPARPRRS